MRKNPNGTFKKKNFLLYLTPFNYYLMNVVAMESGKSMSAVIDEIISEYAAAHPEEAKLAESLMALSKDGE